MTGLLKQMVCIYKWSFGQVPLYMYIYTYGHMLAYRCTAFIKRKFRWLQVGANHKFFVTFENHTVSNTILCMKSTYRFMYKILCLVARYGIK